MDPKQISKKIRLEASLKEEKNQSIAMKSQALNILFVQESPCIRNYKMASALRRCGHRVSLAYTARKLSEIYAGLKDDTYNECIQLKSHRQLWDMSKDYDVIHCHNEPDTLTVAALAGDRPVIHDTHDLISLRDPGEPRLGYFEGIANRGAAGRVYSTAYQKDEARALYNVTGPSLVLYNYASASDLPETHLPKLSKNRDEIHIVYEGGIGGGAHRDFSDLFIQLSKHEIHIHIFPAVHRKEQAELFSNFSRIHYYPPVSPKKLIEIMTQFDFGIIPFNMKKGSKRFLDSTLANKLFEYLAAGLPVIASPLKSYVDFFSKNPVGIVFNSLEDIVKRIPQLIEIGSKTDFSNQIFTFEEEIERLETFYREIKEKAEPRFRGTSWKKRGANLSRKPPETKVLGSCPRLKEISAQLVIRQTSHRPLLDLMATQWLPTEKLQEIQQIFLEMLLKEISQKVPFYMKTMDEAGIRPERIRSINDLKQFPIIDKHTLQTHYQDMLNVDVDQLEKHYTATGGSTGRALKYVVSPEVYYYGFGCRNRGFSWAGFDEDEDKVAYFAGGSLGVTDKVQIEGTKLKVPATGITSKLVMQKYYDALEWFAPKYMRAYPSALYQFCIFLQEIEKPLKLRSVVTTAETLFDYQRKLIEEVLECRIFNEYGAYDGGAGAFECPEHDGLHLQMERGIIELLDESGNDVKPGEMGRIVVTDLHNYIFPFIRYDVGDLAVATDRKCPCGRGLQLIDGIKGRSSDYIILRDGAKLSGEAVIHLFNKLLQENRIDILQYQVIQRSDKSVRILVIPGKKYRNADLDTVRSVFQDHLKGLQISVEEVADMIRTPSGKMRFVFSEIESAKITKPQRILHQKRAKPRICHIGGAHSVHVADIVHELDMKEYNQFVISYLPEDQSITLPHVPVYSFPYRKYDHADWKTQNLEYLLNQFLRQVFEREKPDLVHGHSLTYSCVPVWLAKERFGLKTVVMPWSIHTILDPNPIANVYEKKCLSSVDRFLYPLPEGFRYFQSFYGEMTAGQLVHFKALVDLSYYEKRREIQDKPRILSARVMGQLYHQDLLIKALPRFVKAFPDTRVTLIIGQHVSQGQPYFDQMKTLAQKLGVAPYCDFIGRSLSKAEFSDQIKAHNIVYSMSTHDEGVSGTNIQSAYSGAITIIQKSNWVRGILEDRENVLQTPVDEQSVSDTLLYAGHHLVELQKRFLKNNRKLKQYAKEVMMKNLVRCYEELYKENENKGRNVIHKSYQYGS